MKKLIDNKLEKLFPPAMRAAGYIPIVFGLLLIIPGAYISALIFILIGSFITFANNGIQLDTNTNRSKQYVSYLGLRMGKWKSMEQYHHISILRSRETTTAFSRSNRRTTTSEDVYYDITLLDDTHRQKLGVKRSKSEKLALESAKELVDILGFDFVKYSPQVSEQTRSRRRGERISHK